MYKKNRLCVLAVGIICICVLTACGKKSAQEEPNVLYEFGGQKITYGEFYIYAKTIEEDYQKTYGNGIWNVELETENGKQSVRDVTVNDIISDINRVKVLAAHAKDSDLLLDESEQEEVENTSTAFYKGLTEQDIKETEITKELVIQVLEENMLAGKVYDQMISDHDFEISDEEARMSTFCDIIFECYSEEIDGTIKEFSDEKKATQLEKANEALSSLAQDEKVTYASIIDKYHLEYADTYTMSKTDLIKEYGEFVTDQILNLSDGEVSSVVESQYGYHIFKMIKGNNEDLTKKNKEEIIASMKKEYFSGVYAEWLQEYDSRFRVEDVNMELIKDFPFTKSEEE